MNKPLLAILLALFGATSFSQTFEIKTEFEDSSGNQLKNISNLYFDEYGGYFYITEDENGGSFVTNVDTLNLPKRKGTGGIYGKNGEISSYYTSMDSFYYKNTNSTKYFAGGYGEIINHITDFHKDNVAIATEKNDSIFHFINGKLLSKNHKKDCRGFPSIDKWCAFSENGNALYFIYKEGQFNLYKNSNLIDSSLTRFTGLRINNQGDVFYGIGKEGIPNTKFNYMFFPKYNGVTYDSVRTIWKSYLNNNGAYYCSGGNPFYLLINGQYFEYPLPSDIVLPNAKHFFFFDESKRKSFYYTDHSRKSVGKWKIIKPTMDQNGDFSMFLKRGRKTKVLTNGKIQTDKVVGSPIAVNSTGSYFTFEQSKQTIKIYKNDSLIIEEIGGIRIYNESDFFSTFSRHQTNDVPNLGKDFTYFETDYRGYIIWDGVIGEAIKRVSKSTGGNEYPEVGELLLGDVNENGFYIFQYDGNRKTKLILNNKIFELQLEIDSIIENSIFFRKDGIVFYAITNDQVKRFEIVE